MKFLNIVIVVECIIEFIANNKSSQIIEKIFIHVNTKNASTLEDYYLVKILFNSFWVSLLCSGLLLFINNSPP